MPRPTPSSLRLGGCDPRGLHADGARGCLTSKGGAARAAPLEHSGRSLRPLVARMDPAMKVRSSLKSLKGRHRDGKIVRRKGVVYVINKTDPRFKAKQG